MNKIIRFINDNYKSGIKYAILVMGIYCFLLIANNDDDYKDIFLPLGIFGGACIVGYTLLQKKQD